MMHDLVHLHSELNESVERLAELQPVFNLLIELLDEELDTEQVQQVRWILLQISLTVDCERDYLFGCSSQLSRFQSRCHSEAS